jgi:chromosomal replication initiator protein
LKSARRNREVTVPRQVAMFLTREIVGLSLPRIGESFGGRDHTTVMHSCEKVQDILRGNPGFLSQMDDIRRLIKDGK